MNLHIFFLLTIHMYVATCNDVKYQENNRMVGLDTIHNVRIDKDTIINRNMDLKKKYRGKTSSKDAEEVPSPDWSYSSFPKDVREHVEEFKRNMSDCLREVQANDKRPVKRLSPNKESPVHGECLIACVLKRNGVIDNGKVHKENLLTLVKKFFAKDEKLVKKLKKNLDRCIEVSVRSKDECKIAASLNECTNDLMANNKHKIIVNY